VDAGSAFSDSTSLYSDIMKYRFENGRRYHSYKDGEYWGPNDEKQNNQLDIAHNLYLLTFKGKLFLAPIGDNPQRVLDVGTGTGIWATDFADQYPSAEVIGFDLSPIQPTWVAPNVRFEVNDACEAEWGYTTNSFDFVHARAMYGSIADWPEFYQKVLV
jgi:SAM-dependent methyltransferase